MANWEKKIRSGGGDDLQPGEELVGGILLNPLGTTSRMVGAQLGGVVGAVVADRAADRRAAADAANDRGDAAGTGDDTPVDGGIAARMPDTRCWLGLTTGRLLVWGVSAMSGKPKGLQLVLDRSDLAEVELERRTTSHAVTLRFRDGSAKRYEAPRMLNDPAAFAASVDAGGA